MPAALRTSLIALVIITAFVSGAQSSLFAQSAPALITQPVNNANRIRLIGNVHPLARAQYDQGEAPSDLMLHRLLLVLKRSPQREAALRSLIENQQSQSSPDYHRWLTPQEFGERFGAAESDITALTQWLLQNRLQVTDVSTGRMFLEFSGTAGDIKAAFGAPIHRFTVNGADHWANISDPTVPAALSPVIAGIDSLHSFRREPSNAPVLQHPPQGNSSLEQLQPQYTFNNGQGNYYPLVPFDFATIYDVLPLWDATPTPITGAGQNIAIVARTDIDPGDTTTFWQVYALDGIHAPKPTLVRTYNGVSPGINEDESEADIDTQWSGAVAPGATINLVISASTETTDGVDLSALYIVDNNLAPVLSQSYGQCEAGMGTAGVQFYGTLWEQAAAQGITAVVSTGDNGAAGCDNPSTVAKNGLAVNGIASSPFNTAVGGTDFNQNQTWTTYWNVTNDPVTHASAKGYIPETTWNDSCTNGLLQQLQGGAASVEQNCNNTAFNGFLNSTGGSGGKSSSWLKPTWQTSTPADNARDLPDVSLFASNGFLGSYYLVCQNYLNNDCQNPNVGFGGTSVSAPAFAGIMAMVNQKTGSPQGVGGLVLYKLAAQQPAAFHDVPAGTTIAMPCVTGSSGCKTTTPSDAYGVLSGYDTASGFDLATGLGSIDAASFVNNWSKISFSPSSTNLTLNGGTAVNVQHGSSVPVGIQVAPAVATGDVALMASPGQPGDPGFASFKLAGGAITGSTQLLPGGSYSVMAHYGGDTAYGGSYSNTVPVVVAAEQSKIFANLIAININGNIDSRSATGGTYGSGWTLFRADIGNAAATYSIGGISSTCSNHTASCPTGSITLAAPGTALDSVSLALNNQGMAETQPLTPGNYAITVTYPGDPSYASNKASTSFVINKAPTTASAAVGPLTVDYGNYNQVDVDISTQSNGAAPTGTFQFFVDGSPVGSPVPVYESSGYQPTNTSTPFAWADAQSEAAFTSVGSHTLFAQYSGDGNYAASTSPTVPVNVTKAQPLILGWGWGTPTAAVGQTVSPTANITGSQFGVEPTGTFTFYDGSNLIQAPITTSSAGQLLTVSTTYTFTTTGSHSLNFSYSGDSNYLPVQTVFGDTINVAGPVSVAPTGNINIPSPGQSGTTMTATADPFNFSGAVTLSCVASAPESKCALSSGATSGSSIQINVNGSAVAVTMNVSTTAPTTAAAEENPGIINGFRPIALAGILLICIPLARRRSKAWLVLISLAVLCGLGACGGGGGSPSGSGGKVIDAGTSPGSYNFIVNATTGTGASQIVTAAQVVVLVQ